MDTGFRSISPGYRGNPVARIIHRLSVSTLDEDNLWKIVERLGVTDEKTWLRNSECLIPEVDTLPPDKNLHDGMNSCHVIGPRFIGGILKGANLLARKPGPHRVRSPHGARVGQTGRPGTWPEDPENLIPRPARCCPD